MAIDGLTNRGLSFPEIGSIRKGDKKGDRAPGKDLQWFRAEFDIEEKAALTTFMQVYGARPAELNVFLPFDDIERMWDPFYEAYVAGGLVYRSDGRYVLYEIDPATGKKIVVNGQPSAPHRANPVGFYGQKREPINAKATGHLKIIIPELGRAAYLVVHTTSIHDIINISDQLNALKAINGGRLAGIPLKLRRRPKSISTPSGEGGKRARRIKWLLSIEADPDWVSKMIKSVANAALPAGYETLALAAAPTTIIDQKGSPVETDIPDTDDSDDYEDEFDGEEDGEVIEQRAEEKPSAPKPAQPATNGNSKKPSLANQIKTARWKDMKAAIAEQFPQYRDANGEPNAFHILHALEQEGITEITEQNIQDMPSVIAKHLAEKDAQPA